MEGICPVILVLQGLWVLGGTAKIKVSIKPRMNKPIPFVPDPIALVMKFYLM